MQRNRGLRVKFILGLTAMLIIFTAIGFMVVWFRLVPRQKASLIAIAKNSATLSVNPLSQTYSAYRDTVGLKLPTAMRPLASSLSFIEYFQIIDAKDSPGKVLYDSRSLKRSVVAETITEPNILSAIKANKTSEIISNEAYTIIAPYSDSDGNHSWSLRYFLSFNQLQQQTRDLFSQIIFLTVIFVILGSIGITWLINQTILTPIDRVRADMNAVANGNLDGRVSIKSNDEFRLLAQNINNTLEGLTTTVKSLEEEKAWKNEFIVLASHNLRSPLTVIMSAVSSLKKDSAISDESKKLIDYIYLRGKELHGIIENLLSISMLKGDKMKVQKEPFDLIVLLNTLIGNQENRLKEKNLSVKFDTKAQHAIIKGDEDQLTQVIDNILDNAIKFSKEGGTILVKLTETQQDATLSIKDNGPGIDADMVNKLFQSFRRGADPLSVDHKGAGLGLYFVKLAVESHGGEVAIRSQQGEGTEIIIRLPKAII